jgi:hypothetical protein
MNASLKLKEPEPTTTQTTTTTRKKKTITRIIAPLAIGLHTLTHPPPPLLHLCLYCAGDGHIALYCPLKDKKNNNNRKNHIHTTLLGPEPTPESKNT